MVDIQRGDIVLVNLKPAKGSEQGGIRPCLVIQNDIGNRYSLTTIIAPITSKKFSKEFPTNVFLTRKESKLDKDSTILFNQITTIDKTRIVKKISSLDIGLMKKTELAIQISLGLLVA